MGDGYEYYIRLKDYMSASFKKAGANAQAFHAKARRVADGVTARFKRVPPVIDRMRMSFKGARKDLNNMVSGFGKLGIAMSAFFLVQQAFTLGAELEQTRISYQTLLQDVQKGNQLMSQVDQFANVTPYTNKVLHENTKLLLNFGIEGKKVMPILRNIGEVASGSADKYKRLSLAFSQASSLGRLQGQDLKQMIEAGFNPLLEISRKTGESMAQLRAKMERGEISVSMLEGAFASASEVGGRFHKMLEKQSKTMGGRWSTLLGKLQIGVAKLMEKLAPYFIQLINVGINVIDMFSDLYHWFNNLNPAMQTAIKWVAGLAAGWKIMNMVMNANPILRIIALIFSLISAIAHLRATYTGWANTFTAVGKTISFVAVSIWESFKHAFKMIALDMEALFYKIVVFVEKAAKAIKSIYSSKLKKGYLPGQKVPVTDPLSHAEHQVQNLKAARNKQLSNYANGRLKDYAEMQAAWQKTGIHKKTTEAGETVDGALSPSSSNNFMSSNEKATGKGSAAESIVTGGRKTLIVNVEFNSPVAHVTNHITDGVQQAENFVDIILDGISRRIGGSVKTASQ